MADICFFEPDFNPADGTLDKSFFSVSFLVGQTYDFDIFGYKFKATITEELDDVYHFEIAGNVTKETR